MTRQPVTTAERLKWMMMERGLSLGKLARAAEMDETHLRRVLKGTVNLGLKKAEMLAAALGVGLMDLIGGEVVRENAIASPTETGRAAQVRRFGEWMLGLPRDVRATVYQVGEGLTRMAEGRALSKLPGNPWSETQDSEAGPRRPHKRALAEGRTERPKKNGTE